MKKNQIRIERNIWLCFETISIQVVIVERVEIAMRHHRMTTSFCYASDFRRFQHLKFSCFSLPLQALPYSLVFAFWHLFILFCLFYKCLFQLDITIVSAENCRHSLAKSVRNLNESFCFILLLCLICLFHCVFLSLCVLTVFSLSPFLITQNHTTLASLIVFWFLSPTLV